MGSRQDPLCSLPHHHPDHFLSKLNLGKDPEAWISNCSPLSLILWPQASNFLMRPLTSFITPVCSGLILIALLRELCSNGQLQSSPRPEEQHNSKSWSREEGKALGTCDAHVRSKRSEGLKSSVPACQGRKQIQRGKWSMAREQGPICARLCKLSVCSTHGKAHLQT